MHSAVLEVYHAALKPESLQCNICGAKQHFQLEILSAQKLESELVRPK